MCKNTFRKYLIMRNYKYYYREHGKLKGISLKIFNPLFQKALYLKRVDRVVLKSIKKLTKVFGLDKGKLRESKLGDIYRNINYRSNYKNQPRKYIPYELGIEGFFKELNARNTDYVILRWFENLPKWPTGEDIDILIRDKDLDKILDLFSNKRVGIPIDTYTLNGTKGCSYGVAGAYYPPNLGKEILNNKTLYKDIYYIPNSQYHFKSLIYHIVYHKAEKSGLRISQNIGREYMDNDHDYESIIKEFPLSAELEEEINLKSLQKYLKQNQFVPKLDTLRKLYMVEQSDFLYKLAKAEKIDGIEPYDLIVFFVREWAFENNKVIDIIDTIEKNNLSIISYYYLKGSVKDKVTKKVRGGNWDKGPYPVSGGKPQLVIIAFDYHPQIIDDTNSSHPFVSNSNVFIKGKVRDKINSQMLANKWVNSIHSSDDFVEAKDYIDIIDSNLYDLVKAKVDNRISMYHTNQVIQTLPSNNTRSKTEIIEFNGEKAVKKTYKKGKGRYYDKELFAYKELSKRVPFIPPILEIGQNYFVIPFYQNILKDLNEVKKNKVLKEHKGEIITFLKAIYNEGFALIDFNPENIIITPDKEIIIIDFEFLYKYSKIPNEFLTSYDIKGVPNDFKGDLPKGIVPPGVTYNNTWKRILGKIK